MAEDYLEVQFKGCLTSAMKTDDFYLATAKDSRGRTCLSIAEGRDPQSSLSKFILSLVLFHGQYQIKEGYPAHESATCIVVLAAWIRDGKTTPVALKFMKHRDQFEREMGVRQQQQLDPKFVMGVLGCHSTEGHSWDKGGGLTLVPADNGKFRSSIAEYMHNGRASFFEEYSYCAVLPQGNRGLHETITHEYIAGVASRIHDMKSIMLQVAESLEHMHNSNVIHADLKPLNVMYMANVMYEEHWTLIDLDAAAKIGGATGLKSSTGYAPPELLIVGSDGMVRVRNPEDDSEKLEADISFDMWSYGALLYLFLTGRTLFHNDQQDNLEGQDLLNLKQWDQAQLTKALGKVGDKLGKELLQKLLQPQARDRPTRMAEVLDDPFFSSAALERHIEDSRLQAANAEEGRAAAEADNQAFIQKTMKFAAEDRVKYDRVFTSLVPSRSFQQLLGVCSTLVRDLAPSPPETLRQNLVPNGGETTVDDVMAAAEQNDEQFHRLIQQLLAGQEGEYLQGPMKTKSRIEEKAETDYRLEAGEHDPYSRIIDAVRGTCKFEAAEGMLAFIAKLKVQHARGDVTVLRVKDRICTKPLGSGYRDCLMNISVGGGSGGLPAFICELQLQFAEYNRLKEPEHRTYEYRQIMKGVECTRAKIRFSEKELLVACAAGGGGDKLTVLCCREGTAYYKAVLDDYGGGAKEAARASVAFLAAGLCKVLSTGRTAAAEAAVNGNTGALVVMHRLGLHVYPLTGSCPSPAIPNGTSKSWQTGSAEEGHLLSIVKWRSS